MPKSFLNPQLIFLGAKMEKKKNVHTCRCNNKSHCAHICCKRHLRKVTCSVKKEIFIVIVEFTVEIK